MVYSNSSNLAQHRRTIHPKDFLRRYLCEYCEKTFSLVTNLRRHQKKTCPNAKRSEAGNEATRQTWPCEDCGKICSTKGNLKSHKFTHLGIKMYECFICEKKFTTNSNLKQHLIVHDGKYNGLQPKRKKITLQIRDDKLNDSSEPDPSETSAAVRTLQIVSESVLPLKEEYIAIPETPALPRGRTQRPLIVKVDVDRDVKPRRHSISNKPILLPPPPLRLSWSDLSLRIKSAIITVSESFRRRITWQFCRIDRDFLDNLGRYNQLFEPLERMEKKKCN